MLERHPVQRSPINATSARGNECRLSEEFHCCFAFRKTTFTGSFLIASAELNTPNLYWQISQPFFYTKATLRRRPKAISVFRPETVQCASLSQLDGRPEQQGVHSSIVHCDPKLLIVMVTDTSSYVGGAVILHVSPDRNEILITHSSRSLTPAEQRQYQNFDIQYRYAEIFGLANVISQLIDNPATPEVNLVIAALSIDGQTVAASKSSCKPGDCTGYPACNFVNTKVVQFKVDSHVFARDYWPSHDGCPQGHILQKSGGVKNGVSVGKTSARDARIDSVHAIFRKSQCATVAFHWTFFWELYTTDDRV
ncbi:gap-Pol polyprotein [Clonorchis sinensis]|uniref:Gap-Pol polyprotein n=1 Tax=Clonorchis sinensis TaxID=79923 RepID=G7Y2M5_CLOSI|nr:gap-Pol polyprotein [Clonorchis sinensis]